MLLHLLKQSLVVEPVSDVYAWGQFILRVSTALIIFYVHGWHKLKGGLAHLRNGARWTLAEEVAQMHFPAPVASAFAATLVQFICSLGLIVGLLTRMNAALLTATLSIAIFQNLLARRDPQLAILYTLIVLALTLMGGGPFSLDAKLFN